MLALKPHITGLIRQYPVVVVWYEGSRAWASCITSIGMAHTVVWSALLPYRFSNPRNIVQGVLMLSIGFLEAGGF